MTPESINPTSPESRNRPSRIVKTLTSISRPIHIIRNKMRNQKEQWQSQLKKGRDLFLSKFEKNQKADLLAVEQVTHNINQNVTKTNIKEFGDLNIPAIDKPRLLELLDTQFKVEGADELTSYHEELAYLDEMLTNFKRYYNSLLDGQSGYEDIARLNPALPQDDTYKSQLADIQELVVAYTGKYTEISSALALAREPYLPYTIGAPDRVINPGKFIEDTIGLDNTYDTNKLERQSIEYHQSIIDYYKSSGYPIPESNSELIPNPTTQEQMFQKSVNQVAWMTDGDKAEVEFNKTLSTHPNVLVVVNAPRYSNMDNVEKMDAMVIGRSEGPVSEIEESDVLEIQILLSKLMTTNYLKNTLLAVDYPEFNVRKAIKPSMDKNEITQSFIDFEAQLLLGITRTSVVRGARENNVKGKNIKNAIANANGEIYMTDELRDLKKELETTPEASKDALKTRIYNLQVLIGYSEDDYEKLNNKSKIFTNPLLLNQALPLFARPLSSISMYYKGRNILDEKLKTEDVDVASGTEQAFYTAYDNHLLSKIVEETQRIQSLDLSEPVNRLLDKLKITKNNARKEKSRQLTDQLRAKMIELLPLKHSFDKEFLESYSDPALSIRLNQLLRKNNLTAQLVQLKDKIDAPVIAKFNDSTKFTPTSRVVTSRRTDKEVMYSGLISTLGDPTKPKDKSSKLPILDNYGIFLGYESADHAYMARVNPNSRKTIQPESATLPMSNKPVPEPIVEEPVITPKEIIKPATPAPVIKVTPDKPVAITPEPTPPIAEPAIIDEVKVAPAAPLINPPILPDKPITKVTTPTPIPTPTPTVDRPIIKTPPTPAEPVTTVTNTTKSENTELKFSKRINTPDIKVDYNNLNTLKKYTNTLSPINEDIKTVIYQGLLNTFEVGLNSSGEVVAYDKSGSQCLVTINNGNLIVVPEGLEKGYNLSMKRYVVHDIFSKLS
jgi:hypothetical protein